MEMKECNVFENCIVNGCLEDFIDFWETVQSDKDMKERFLTALVDKKINLFVDFSGKSLAFTSAMRDVAGSVSKIFSKNPTNELELAALRFKAFTSDYCASVVDFTETVKKRAPKECVIALQSEVEKFEKGNGAKVSGEEIRVVKMFFPPEVADSILRDLGLQSQTVLPGKKEPEAQKKQPKIKFNFDMVSTNKDLKTLIEKLKNSKTKAYSLLLYGAPGVGKSYLALYLAQELGLNVLKKKASDMLSRFVGDTEKQIAAAFQEAIDTNSLLILDEADSLLTDRSKAKQDFQVSSVNTMLTCMESHPLPFVCTTNLKDWLDKASMRRFIFKIKYDEMGHKQIQAGVNEYFSKRIKLTEEDTKDLKHITAGDFPVVKKKLDILEDGKYTKENILEQLKEEQAEKGIFEPKTIGF